MNHTATGFQIFISYSSKDANLANALVARLEAADHRCWIAPRDIPPGSPWADSIMNGLEQCRMMVLLLSQNANMSPVVLREVDRAVNKGLLLLPVMLENVMPSGGLELYVGAVHWLDATTPPFEEHLDNLVNKIGALLQVSQSSPSEPPSRMASRRQISSGNYINRSPIIDRTGGASGLVLTADQFREAPFIVVSSGDSLGWMERVKKSDGTWVYAIRDGDIEFSDEQTVEAWYLAFSRHDFKFTSTVESRLTELQKDFGEQATHADFEDVKIAAALLDTPRLIDLLGLRDVRNPEIPAYDGVDYWSQGPFVTYKGATAEGSRAYFISVHDGILIDDWRIIDTIENHNIDLGSWHNNRKVLVKVSQSLVLSKEGGELVVKAPADT